MTIAQDFWDSILMLNGVDFCHVGTEKNIIWTRLVLLPSSTLEKMRSIKRLILMLISIDFVVLVFVILLNFG